jgi:hypothetical protein
MYPNIFVSEDFFDFFDEEYDKLPQEEKYNTPLELKNKRDSINRIKELFLASHIYSDINDKSLIKYYTKQFGVYSTFKDFILHTKIRDASFANKPEIRTKQNKDFCQKSGFCFFTNKSFEEAESESKQTGKIIIGKEFLNSPFFLEHTFAAETTNEQIFQIKKAKHPCSGIIIMDRYLFDDVANQKSKIDNLISFLNQIIPIDLEAPFEIDILTQNKSKNALFDKKYNQILSGISKRISLHIYAPKKIEHDRHILTNYAIFSIGLPFVGETNVSCNFFPSNNNIDGIKNSYEIWKDKITIAADIVITTPPKIGELKTIWKSDDLVHSIFNI